MTHINPDDPKWTAYVLGELDESEREAIELELASSEEARTLVEELRLAVDLTKVDLRQEVPIVPLTIQQRAAIRAAAESVAPRRWFGARPAVLVAGLAAAAIVLMVALSPMMLQPPMPQIAKLDRSPAEQVAEQAVEAPTPAVTDEKKPESEFELRYDHPALVPAAPPIASAAPQAKTFEQPVAETQQAALASARVSGRVQDASNASIPGVTVVATNTETGVKTTAVTNESGAYTLDGLQPGKYRVTGSIPGFQTSSDNVEVAANSQEERDIKLQVGQVAQAAEVQQNTTAQLYKEAVSAADSERRQAQQGQEGQQGQAGAGGAAFADRARAAADGLGPVPRQLPQQARSAAASPPPPAPVSAFESARAPGVPAGYDRIVAPGVFNRREPYDIINDNPFLAVGQNPLSTFSVDVDTASYSNVRRFLNQNQLPPRDAVRIEEMINYFTYDYAQPSGNNPIGATIDAASAPWNPQHRLVRIGIKARDIAVGRRPPGNFVFLLDVSGSMQPPERLPMLKDALRLLVEQLTANDRVTVVTYAGTTGVALRPTRGDQKNVILGLIGSLQAGGSTNGASGIQLAYEQAAASFIPNGVNRVILATDGDFNVGITNRDALLRLIEDKAKSGVFLSVLGVGMGNYKDGTLEMLADKGNGNYAYLDTLNEARKVLVDQMSGTLVTMAKDVKIQVEFNPAVVDAYRLIGYENRALRNEDFNNDLKDGGDMGAGHTVTVLYEVVPRGVAINAPAVDPLKYQQLPAPSPAARGSNETLTVKIRYKEPAGSDSKLLMFPLVDREQTFGRANTDFRFASAVASFGMILRDSPFKGTATIDSVLAIAEDSLGSDRNGYRREFLQLVQRARQIRR